MRDRTWFVRMYGKMPNPEKKPQVRPVLMFCFFFAISDEDLLQSKAYWLATSRGSFFITFLYLVTEILCLVIL